MRGVVLAALLSAVLVTGCRNEAAESIAPAGYEERERTIVGSLAECEERVRRMTKGGEFDPQPSEDGVTAYEQTLNTGRRLWQACAVESGGGYAHIVALSPGP